MSVINPIANRFRSALPHAYSIGHIAYFGVVFAEAHGIYAMVAGILMILSGIMVLLGEEV